MPPPHQKHRTLWTIRIRPLRAEWSWTPNGMSHTKGKKGGTRGPWTQRHRRSPPPTKISKGGMHKERTLDAWEQWPIEPSGPWADVGGTNGGGAGDSTTRLAWVICDDHLYVCKENGWPHTLTSHLHADPNSYKYSLYSDTVLKYFYLLTSAQGR